MFELFLRLAFSPALSASIACLSTICECMSLSLTRSCVDGLADLAPQEPVATVAEPSPPSSTAEQLPPAEVAVSAFHCQLSFVCLCMFSFVWGSSTDVVF